MQKTVIKKLVLFCAVFILLLVLGVILFTIFFDQAVIVRKNTIYHIPASEKVVALTFDDGPSLKWTPEILDVLKAAQVKATFFMLGEHVEQYPDVARRVANEGHEIGNHTYDHHVLIYYKTPELEKEILDAQRVIKNVTGQTTKYFRPPKAWLTASEKKDIQKIGYKIILWSLNSKDWVTFDDRYIVKYILHHVRSGDILLFHDSGGLFKPEGGSRKETVKAVARLIEKLSERGYRFVTISQLLQLEVKDGK